MKRKELKNLAKKIANAELIIQSSDDKEKIHRAEQEVIELSGHVDSLDDIAIIDEMVQEFLTKELKSS